MESTTISPTLRPPLADKGPKTAWGIRACFINATLLKKRTGEFTQSLRAMYMGAGVAEYRFGDLVDDHLVKVNGYSTLRQDRNAAGGGVLLYLRNDVKQGY